MRKYLIAAFMMTASAAMAETVSPQESQLRAAVQLLNAEKQAAENSAIQAMAEAEAAKVRAQIAEKERDELKAKYEPAKPAPGAPK